MRKSVFLAVCCAPLFAGAAGDILKDYAAMVTPPEIPRAFDVHRSGCPVCGDAIKKFGMYSWIIDEKKPFKVQCPSCKNIYPDNDYLAYFTSRFQDRSLLRGKIVDDGRGYRKKGVKGKYWFVAYYNHWTFRNRTEKTLRTLAEEYDRSGNPVAARCALVMLDKLATYYERYDYNTQSRYAEEVDPHYTGRILNAIWETQLTESFVDAWAKVRKFCTVSDAELAAATGKSNTELQNHIEKKLLRIIARDIMSQNGRNWGNYGMHQRTLLKVALQLRDRPGSPAAADMVRWVTDFRPSRNAFGIPFDYVLTNNVFGDGMPMESPMYNSFWLDCIAPMVEILGKFGIDNTKREKVLHRLFSAPAKLVVCGQFTPSSGDSGNIGSRGIFGGNVQTLRHAFRNAPSAACIGMLQAQCDLTAEEQKEAEKFSDPLFGYRSNLLSAYGFASLQNENPLRPTALTLSFGHYLGHKHRDALHLELFSGEAPFMPDFGYPDSASGDDPSRYLFYSNTPAHNTLLVNNRAQEEKSGSILAYAPGRFAAYIRAEAPAVYHEVTRYERSALFVEPRGGKMIVVDLFRVSGGLRHDLFFHSAGETVRGADDWQIQLLW